MEEKAKMGTYKYRQNPVFYNPKNKQFYSRKDAKNCLCFGSQLEFTIYRFLEQLVGYENVQLQVPLKIKEKTSIYPELKWRCDFRIYKPYMPREYLNIEAKGIITREFKRNLQYLEYTCPDEFKRLIIVGSNTEDEFIDKKTMMWSINHTTQYLKEQGYCLSVPL